MAPGPATSSILSIREALLSGERTAVDITSEYLSRLRRTEPSVRSFIHVADAAAEREAEELDRRIASGEKDAVGPLAGVLVGVKDNLCTANMPSTGGSRILDGYRPAYDATAVRRLREAGAIVVGKTNLDEFGMGSTTEGSAFQVCERESIILRCLVVAASETKCCDTVCDCQTQLRFEVGFRKTSLPY